MEINYSDIMNRFSGKRILVIGDVMIDSYIWGKVERISPEAPVPIVAVSQRDERLGGAANVALNIQALGATPILCSVLGNDPKASTLLSLLKTQGMSADGIVCSERRTTTIKFRIIGNNFQMLRVDEEIDIPLTKEDEKLFIDKIYKLLENNKIDAVIFEDYDKGSITPAIIEAVSGKAKTMGIPVTVDPKKRNFSEYKNITLFKPNLKELREGLKVNTEILDIPHLNRWALLLHKEQNIDIVMITLSEHGIYISDCREGGADKQKTILIPAHKRNIADVSGAGDTVISVATLALSLRLPTDVIVKVANLAGGIVCESVGVVPIDKERFFKELVKL